VSTPVTSNAGAERYLGRLENSAHPVPPRALVVDSEGHTLFDSGDATLPLALAGVTKLFTVAMVLRQIPNKLLTPEQLGVPEICKKLVTRPRGLFLVTGPTGSGKSTTLAALIDFINHNFDHHIITIEDPIEFYHYSKKSTVNQREVGNDVPSFSEALRRALRQDPDVILVGELRDLETIEAAISAAETGHVVFGTLHTTGAQGTVNRIIDAFPTNQQEQIRTQLSTAILGVVSQTLLPKIGGGRCAAYEVLVVDSGIGT